jgi:hypothetical protein
MAAASRWCREGVAGDPSHVELLGTQPEVVGAEALRCVNVGHSKVGHYAYDAHAVLLSAADVHDDPLDAAACRLAHSGDGLSSVALDRNYRARHVTHSVARSQQSVSAVRLAAVRDRLLPRPRC